MSSKPHAFDLAALQTYLDKAAPGVGTLSDAEKFSGGQSNPTFLLSGDKGKFVLRRKPPGTLLASAHAVDREFRVMQALADTDVPVPRMMHLCDDDDVIGSMFYIMEYCDARVFWSPMMKDTDNATRSAVYDQMNRILAALHSVDVQSAGLGDYGNPGNYFARQLSRWTKQYRASQTDNLTEIEELISWLDANLAEDSGQVSLVHGDYRLDNILWAKDSATPLALIDWELSTLGDPIADLAYQCMQWRLPAVDLLRGLDGIDRPALGIPTEEAYVAQYCTRRGITGVQNWTFALAFSFFRLAGIAQGVKKRAQDGNASSSQAAEVGAVVAMLGQKALEAINEEQDMS